MDDIFGDALAFLGGICGGEEEVELISSIELVSTPTVPHFQEEEKEEEKEEEERKKEQQLSAAAVRNQNASWITFKYFLFAGGKQ